MHSRASYAVVEDFEVKVSCFLSNDDVSEEDKRRYKSPETWEVCMGLAVCVCRSVVDSCVFSPSLTCVCACVCVSMCECLCVSYCILAYVLLSVCSVVVSPHHGHLMCGVQLVMWS